MSEVCRGCASFEHFKEKCYFYWEGKKQCSQFKSHMMAEPTFVSVESLQEVLRKKA